MAERAGLMELAERVERLTGPDREVEARIMSELGLDGGPHGYARPYTESLDAAMSLVPEGWQAIIYTENKTAELYDARLEPRRGILARSWGFNLASALTAACLRARASANERGE